MNIKTFTIIAIASFAVLSVTACGGKQKASIETEQTEETSKTEVIVSDNKLFINSDLYNMSEEKVIFNAHGRLDPDNPSFGTDHIDHYRTLFVKENGGLTVGYVVKTTRGITLQTGKPVWGQDCTHCMACICYCPAEAIEYGKKSLGKPRYHFEAL